MAQATAGSGVGIGESPTARLVSGPALEGDELIKFDRRRIVLLPAFFASESQRSS